MGAPLPIGVEQAPYGPERLLAEGGDGELTWMLLSGSLPVGLSLTPGGEVSGLPAAAGTTDFTAHVRSGDGQRAVAHFSLTIDPPVTLTTSSLPNAVRGVDYGPQRLAWTGGGGSGGWSLTSGTLPAGLNMAATGEITGTPTAVGTSTFTARFTSNDGQAAQQTLPLSVFEALAISTASLPDGVESSAYSAGALAATGGDGAFVWSIASGQLPAGLRLEESGEILGTPTTPGPSTFAVQVRSPDGQATQRALSMSINGTLDVTSTSLPNAARGEDYGSRQLTSTGGSGTGSWSLSSGSLPAGLDLSAAGTVTGTPTVAGTSSFTVRLSTSDGQAAEETLSITVLEPLGISTTFLPAGIESIAYAVGPLTATGGGGGYLWSIASGQLPAGLGLEASGEIAGVPTASGVSIFTVEVSSEDGQSLQGALSISIHATLDVSTSVLPDGLESESYGPISLLATGGSGSATWTVTAGSLPEGLSLSSDGTIGGVPSLLGSSTFTVQAASGDGQTAQRALSIAVTAWPVVQPDQFCADYPSFAIVAFADAGLELAVRGALGADAETRLTCALVSGLTEIRNAHGSALGISNLGGIQNLVGLETLWLASNAIHDIAPMSGLTNLSEVHLQHNQISDIAPLSGLAGLQILSLWDNSVSDIAPLAGLTSLHWLQLSSNDISDISALGGLINLQSLRIYENASLVDIRPLLDNPGLGIGDDVRLRWTGVSCSDVAALEAKGVTVDSDCS